MGKRRKHNRRKRRVEKRDKSKNCPVRIWETKSSPDIGFDELEEEILDLLKAPGATMWFFNEKGEREVKLKIKL